MRPSPITRPAVLATRGALLSLLLLLATGCAGAVEVTVPDLGRTETDTCRSLVDGLPRTVAGLEQRDVEPAQVPAAAWGDPPVVLTCGVSMPPEFDRFSRCVVADGVGWFIPEESLNSREDVTMTTIGLDPTVRVEVPGEYLPPTAVMADLAPALSPYLTGEEPCA